MVKNLLVSDESYSLACINCGSTNNVTLMPHRVDGYVTGMYCFCEECWPMFKGAVVSEKWVTSQEADPVAPKE